MVTVAEMPELLRQAKAVMTETERSARTYGRLS